MTSHPLLTAFRASKPAFGVWLTLNDSVAARTAALASPHMSWVTIDCEHGLTPLVPGAAETINAVAGLGPNAPSILVRVPGTGACAGTSAAWQIKYALDAGARGVVVPMVNNAEQAKAIVAASRFPPAGVRGFGSAFTQTAWGISVAEYLEKANENIVVLGQIETREAVENMEEIFAVEGLDGCFIGPYDLSLSLGLPPPNPDPVPEVEEVIQKILAAAHKAGKKCAFYCTNGEQAAQRAKEGFDMINITSDSAAITESISRNFSTAVGEIAGQKGFSY